MRPFRNKPLRDVRLRALALLCAAASCGAATILLTEGSAASASAAPTASAPAASTNLTATLDADYSVLTENTAASLTPIPAQLANSPWLVKVTSRFGLNVSSTRMAQGPGDAAAWLIPGTAGYCDIIQLAADNESFSCNDTLPADGVIGEVGHDPTGYLFAGLAPNGNASVTLDTASGSSVAAPVSNNAFFATGSATAFSELQVIGLSGALATQAVGLGGAGS